METKIIAITILVGMIAVFGLTTSTPTGMFANNNPERYLKLPHDIETKTPDTERLTACYNKATEDKETCWRILGEGCKERYQTDIKRCNQRYN